MRCTSSLALAAGLCLASPLLASDLKIDGVTSANAAVGTAFTVDLTGNAILPVVVGFDVSPGPVVLFGESFPIGFTPQVSQLAIGATDGAGLYTDTFPIPNNPGLVGATLYFVGVILDPGNANGLDVSNGADLTFDAAPAGPIETQLAGVIRSGPPFFDWITTSPEGEQLPVGIDTGQFTGLVGASVDLYVVADRTESEWGGDATLTDVSGNGVDTIAPTSGDLSLNTFIADLGTLSGDGGDLLGVGYDVVVDVNQNGLLDAGDLIDGLTETGIFVARDPSLPGPHTVVEVLYSGGTFLGQNLFYPADIDQLFDVPIVIVSHGNGHNYQWYDHIGEHLASYGYVVMSHQNNTIPGVETASTTTLTNTDFFLGNLDTIEGGILDGHLDVDNILWLGHSRGGEGVARAYDRIFDGTYVPTNYTGDNIQLISSIAPVDFLGTNSSTPHDKPFHLWVGAADSDVNGCANNDIAQPFHIHARAEDQRQAISLYGVGHGNFHNGTGGAFASGPCLVGDDITHGIMRGYLLPMVEYHLRDNLAGLDYLWRHYEDLHPQSAPLENPCVVANLQYVEENATTREIDSFQDNFSEFVSSSGGTVSTDAILWGEGFLDDNNTTFTHLLSDPANGMTQCRSSDIERGGIFEFDGSGGTFLQYDIVEADEDWSGFGRLHFRLCQTTRHPLTIAELADVSISVRLVDGDGDEAEMALSDQLAGIEEPYQRTGCGTGVGWHNDFESVRLGLAGFQAINPALDLDSIDLLVFVLGNENAQGRLGIDEVELHVR